MDLGRLSHAADDLDELGILGAEPICRVLQMASSVITTLWASIRRLATSRTAVRYTNTLAMRIVVVSSAQTVDRL